MEIRELRAFVAVVDAGGLSAAARTLHLTPSALSQTVASLERRVGGALLVRDNAGARATALGDTLAREARAVLERYDRAMATIAAAAGGTGTLAGHIRVGMPLEFPPGRLPAALAALAAQFPDTRVEARHASSSVQLQALLAGELDIALVRDRPLDPSLDAVPSVCEPMGVIVASARAAEIADERGIALQRLAGLRWFGFDRAEAPAWHDLVTATLRGHGVAVPERVPTDHRPTTAEVKLAEVVGGYAFALAAPGWAQPLPDGVVWHPLVGDPLVRRTWAVWPAASRQRDLGALIAALELVPE